MKKFRFVAAIAVAGLVALGLGASSASASSPSMVEIEGVCLDVDANGLPNPVPCPPDADSLAGDGMFDPFVNICWEQQAGWVMLPVLCAEDDSQASEVPEWCLEEQVDGSYLIVPCSEDEIEFPEWCLEEQVDGSYLIVPCSEDEIEFPEWCLEEQVDGSYLIVPCPEDQWMIPMIPEIHFFPWFSDPDQEVDEESAEVEEAPSEEDSEEAPIENSEEVPAEGDGQEATIEDSEEAPTDEVSDDSQGTVESGRALSYEATDSGAELLMAATPSAVDNQTNQNSAGFTSVSGGSERGIDNVETGSVQPGATASEAPSERGSVGLIAGIALVLLGGGGFAAVGVAASRKRV